MSYPIENEAAYQSAIKANMIRNGCVGRAQRMDDENPMLVRLIAEVINPRHRRQWERHQAKRIADAEKAGAVVHPAGTPPEEMEWDDVLLHKYIPMFDLDDRTGMGEWAAGLDWAYMEDFDFPTQLVLRYLKTSKGLSDKQQAWVVKMVEEEPIREQKAQERREAQQQADAASEWQGAVKERLKGLEVTVEFVKTIDGYYGAKRIVKMRDIDSNLYVTFATSDWVWEAEKGQRLVLDGTVKAHEEYQGAKQTTLTRTKAQPAKETL